MNIDEVIRLLRMTYWADKRSTLQIEKSMQNSSCYGVRLDDNKNLSVLHELSATTPRPIICVTLLLIRLISTWDWGQRLCHI